jgi:hypothetical protein
VSGFRLQVLAGVADDRMRSTVGLKSKPNVVPDSAGVNGAPTATAAPVVGLST